MMDKVGVFALPGNDGSPAPVLLGGSNIAVAAQSPDQDLAKSAVAIMLSDDYQAILAANGLTPAKVSLASELGDDEFAQATIAAASNAKLTPAAAGLGQRRGCSHPRGPVRRHRQRRRHRGARRGGRQGHGGTAQLSAQVARPCVAGTAPVPAARARASQPSAHAPEEVPMSTTMLRTPTPRVEQKSPPARARTRRSLLPYALLLPALLALVAGLGYPLVRQVVLSLQGYGLAQQFGKPAEWVGLDNYVEVLSDPYLWLLVLRSVALLPRLRRHHDVPRHAARAGDAADVEAGPAARADRAAAGVGDAGAGRAHGVAVALRLAVRRRQLAARAVGLDYAGHSWLIEPLSFFFVAAVVVVWMSVPFVAFTVYAGLTQLPQEIIEAAEVDGASPVQRLRHVIVPLTRPVLLIVGLLQVIWDLRVFTQIYVLQNAGGVTRETNLLGTYIYRSGIGEGNFGVAVRRRGLHARADRRADVALRPPDAEGRRPMSLTVRSPYAPGVVDALGVADLRGCASSRSTGWSTPRSSTARDIRAPDPTWLPFGGGLDNYRRLFDDTGFVSALGISLMVTIGTVVVALLFAFLAALAVSRFRFRGRGRSW